MSDIAFTLHGALQRSAEAAPASLAVSAVDGELSYEALVHRAGQYATALREHGVRPGDRVAVSAEKCTDTVAALYGIMAAGAAYVPVDPSMPLARAQSIIDDADCRVICADERRAVRLGEAGTAAPLVAIGSVEAAQAVSVDGSVASALDSGCESDLAYLLYTSGSTGMPKGVMLTHRNALAYADWVVDRFSITAGDRLSNHAPFHFDLSVLDLYAAARAGASVHLLGAETAAFGAEMAKAIASRQLTVWYSVPSALVLLTRTAEPVAVSSLRLVLFAGEVFPVKHLARLKDLLPNATLANLYGPTETNVCTYHVVPERLEGDNPLPIGRACENQEVFALDEALRPVEVGEVGELFVRGPTVMKGYWGDAGRTAEVLVQNPLHDKFDDPTYRTGDMVRRLPGDEFEFLGRRDHQIKSRGYRIELGEIEQALLRHEAVTEAAVVAIPDDDLGHALHAFVAIVAGDADEMSLKRHLSTQLPRYMIPRSIAITDALPRTSTGKVDRKRLEESIA
ncbi:MAG: amino acid adenylation domain-containing protein [Actinomycetota bacterium]